MSNHAIKWFLFITTGTFCLIVCVAVTIHRSIDKTGSVLPPTMRQTEYDNALAWRNSAEYTNVSKHFDAIRESTKSKGDFIDSDIQFLIQSMVNTQYFYFRVTALDMVPRASSQHSKSALEPFVLGCLTDEVPAVRIEAAQVLPSIGDKLVISNLNILINDTNPRVARAASNAVARLSRQ